jgi:hypothetical protein
MKYADVMSCHEAIGYLQGLAGRQSETPLAAKARP